jgi:hypothetical protein
MNRPFSCLFFRLKFLSVLFVSLSRFKLFVFVVVVVVFDVVVVVVIQPRIVAVVVVVV